MSIRRKLWNIAANIAAQLRPFEPLYHYVLVRADIPFGVQLAQSIHASENEPPGTHVVALHANNEQELLSLEVQLQALGYTYKAVREPDAPWNGQLMAIGIASQLRTPQLKKLMSKYKLAK